MTRKQTPKQRAVASGVTHSDREQEVLAALRRVIRAVDLQSKQVVKVSGLTVPQILILRAISDLGEVTTGTISNAVNLSQATVTTILDRLESRNLIERYRSDRDRRVVHARLTGDGRKRLAKAPNLFHQTFTRAFSELEPAYQARIVSTLEEVAVMLGGGTLDVAPIVHIDEMTVNNVG
ncbi:MAG: MarR family transcriptional regulator [Rhodospirillales bacterium]